MTHNSVNHPYGGLGMPTAGFASRGKGSAIKRLNLASAPKVSSISEHPDAVPAAPRTSRSHLLAGLRTAPKTPSTLPSSAPYTKSAPMNFGLPQYQKSAYNAPHTAIGSSFSSLGQQYHSINPGQQFYSLPEQVLAPPPLEIDENDEQMDPAVIAQLYATELYLAQRQQQLQQQLAQFHTAQQLAAMSINPHAKRGQHSYPQTPVTPHNMYNGNPASQIFTQEIAGQPGVYVVYNAITGQSSLAFDPAQQVELANSPPPPTPARINTSFGSNTSSPFGTGSPIGSRSRSPPKKSASPPIDVQPLPPPSANAFRRGHNRNRSSLVLNPTGSAGDGPRSSRASATPLTGTFGPGQGRAGEHPVRQPAGPPPFEELQAKPTSKHEGSKNFATRQRRRALNTLVRAGLERRVGSASGSPIAETGSSVGSGGSGSGSAGSTTPVSDAELTFSVPSDNDSDCGLPGLVGLVKEAPLPAV
jgi:hypothetical protein